METNMDQMLVSSLFNLHSSVPSSFVQPPESRPGNLLVDSGKTIPVIDLGTHDHPPNTPNHILKACEEYGFFQVINHGVSKELMEDTMNTFKEFHAMPAKEKIIQSSKDSNGSCKLYASREIYKNDAVQYWRDTLRYPCPASAECMDFWPHKPAGYREVVGKYAQELRILGMKILKLLADGLGLNPEYFCGGLGEKSAVLAHHYPPCPEPSLTLGAPKHRDPTLITILLQDKGINALQVFKDGKWIGVEPIPNAFVINVGHLLQIVSNGRLLGAEHRVVTNASTARTTVAYFIIPRDENIIEPAKTLINSRTPPSYRSISFAEFHRNFLNKGPNFEAELHS